MGMPEGLEQGFTATDITLTLDARTYRQNAGNGIKGLQPADMLTLTVTDREICQLGDFMLYKGGRYYI